MIQASGHSDDGKRFILLGLSAENVRRLQNGEPIIIDMKQHGYEATLSIFYGRTEQEMEAMVKSNFTMGTQ